MAGAFLSFEGIDGTGKSTQLCLLASVLRLRGLETVSTREPGGTPLGTRLREALLDIDTVVDPLAELLLYAADRAQHVRTLIRPALKAGHIVLSDRYADATIAYQGAGRGLAMGTVSSVVALATDGLQPDLTLVFDLPVAEAIRRAGVRATSADERKQDRLDQEGTEFYTRVRDAYLQIAAHEPTRVHVVDATGTVNETHQRVLRLVMPLLQERGAVRGNDI